MRWITDFVESGLCVSGRRTTRMLVKLLVVEAESGKDEECDEDRATTQAVRVSRLTRGNFGFSLLFRSTKSISGVLYRENSRNFCRVPGC
jgi:hypothetical protein